MASKRPSLPHFNLKKIESKIEQVKATFNYETEFKKEFKGFIREIDDIPDFWEESEKIKKKPPIKEDDLGLNYKIMG